MHVARDRRRRVVGGRRSGTMMALVRHGAGQVMVMVVSTVEGASRCRMMLVVQLVVGVVRGRVEGRRCRGRHVRISVMIVMLRGDIVADCPTVLLVLAAAVHRRRVVPMVLRVLGVAVRVVVVVVMRLLVVRRHSLGRHHVARPLLLVAAAVSSMLNPTGLRNRCLVRLWLLLLMLMLVGLLVGVGVRVVLLVHLLQLVHDHG